MLNVFSIPQVNNVYHIPFYFVTGCRHPKKVTFMGAMKCFTGGYLIPFSYLVVYLYRQVREGWPEDTIKKIEHTIRSIGISCRGSTINKIRSECLIEGIH